MVINFFLQTALALLGHPNKTSELIFFVTAKNGEKLFFCKLCRLPPGHPQLPFFGSVPWMLASGKKMMELVGYHDDVNDNGEEDDNDYDHDQDDEDDVGLWQEDNGPLVGDDHDGGDDNGEDDDHDDYQDNDDGDNGDGISLF